jgi:histidine triad (HIT) family protein
MTHQSCLFCKIVAGAIPADIVMQNEHLVIFKDIAPKAPAHLLIVPKKHLLNINELTEEDAALSWQLVRAARELAQKYGNDGDHGFNLIANNGRSAGQAVDHLHWHFIAGRNIYEGGFSL